MTDLFLHPPQEKSLSRCLLGKTFPIGDSPLGSFQEAVDDLLLCFLLGEAEGHELDKLLAGDLADGGFVDQLSLRAVESCGEAMTWASSMMMASHSVWP